MKKLVRILIVLVIVLIVAVVTVGIFFDSIVKKSIEKVGPMVTKTDVKLDSFGLSFLSGSGKIKGLIIGNPEGFKTPNAISVGMASLAVKPGSVLSDKIVIQSIVVQAPEITFETDLSHNNLSQLQANVNASTGGGGSSSGSTGAEKSAAPQGSKPSKKLEVDEFVITDAKLNVSVTTMGGKSLTVPLPPIKLSNLGTGPDGITAAELTKDVLDAIYKEAAPAAAGAVANLSKLGTDAVNGAMKTGADTLNKASGGIGDLFKKK